MLCEEEQDHARWDAALHGRRPSDLPLPELRGLLSTAMPLKHRLELWPSLFVATGPLAKPEVPEDVANLIQLDVPRTRPSWLCDEQRTALRNVLLGFAAQQPDVGYCQGLNFMAATLLVLGFEEQVAIQGLETMVSRCCPDYHGQSLLGFRRDIRVLEQLTSRPGVLTAQEQSRLKDLGVPLSALAAEHFLTLGSGGQWPLSVTVLLWDFFLVEGPGALFASFLAMLQYLPAEVDDEEPVEAFRRQVLLAVAEDPMALLSRARALLPLLPDALIQDLRRCV